MVDGEDSGLAIQGWNASAIGSKVLGDDSLYWVQPAYKVRAQITQWLKESKLNNSKISNYEARAHFVRR